MKEYFEFTNKKFFQLSIEEKKMVLEWRNSMFVRSQMVNQDIITWDNHLRFIENLKTDVKSDFRLVCSDVDYLGVITLKNINDGQAEIGLYKNPGLVRIKKVGRIMVDIVFKLAAERRLNKLNLIVKKDNNIAISLYKKTGFKIIHDEGNYWQMEIIL